MVGLKNHTAMLDASNRKITELEKTYTEEQMLPLRIAHDQIVKMGEFIKKVCEMLPKQMRVRKIFSDAQIKNRRLTREKEAQMAAQKGTDEDSNTDTDLSEVECEVEGSGSLEERLPLRAKLSDVHEALRALLRIEYNQARLDDLDSGLSNAFVDAKEEARISVVINSLVQYKLLPPLPITLKVRRHRSVSKRALRPPTEPSNSSGSCIRTLTDVAPSIVGTDHAVRLLASLPPFVSSDLDMTRQAAINISCQIIDSSQFALAREELSIRMRGLYTPKPHIVKMVIPEAQLSEGLLRMKSALSVLNSSSNMDPEILQRSLRKASRKKLI